MFYLIVQTVLLIAIAFILGAILGCLLRRWFAADAVIEAAPSRAATTGAATTGAAATAGGAATAAALTSARAPHVPAAPLPDVEPKVVPQPVAAPVPPRPVEADRPEEVEVRSPERDAPEAEAQTPAPTQDAPPAKREAGKARAKAARKTTRKPAAKAKVAAAAEGGLPDNLKRMRGIGPQNEGRLNAMGVETFAQIAAWTKKDQREMGERLSFPGRIEREEWVKQAKQLAKGKGTEFSARADAGRVKTSSGAAVASAPGTKPPTLDAARDGKPDNLTLIDGVGNAIERKLFKLGIFHFDQVAAWSEDEGVWVGNEIGFPGRVARENWIGEARIFAEGGTTEHAARVERGQIRTSRKSTRDES